MRHTMRLQSTSSQGGSQMRIVHPTLPVPVKQLVFVHVGQLFEPINPVDGEPTGEFYIRVVDRRTCRKNPVDRVVANLLTGDLKTLHESTMVKVFNDAEIALVPAHTHDEQITSRLPA